MIGFALGNALGPQFWLDKYKPSNRVPWALTLMSAVISICCILALRFLFSQENQRRERMQTEAARSGGDIRPFQDWSMIETVTSDGEVEQRKVAKMFLDLTDSENLAFRYVL